MMLDNPVDQTERNSLVRGHKIITLGVTLNLLKRTSCSFGKNLINVTACPLYVVSMNQWGFQKSYQEEAWDGFGPFLEKACQENPLKGEYFLPSVISALIEEGKARVKVLRSNDKWYGVTYKEDKPGVVAALAELREKGVYPAELWG